MLTQIFEVKVSGERWFWLGKFGPRATGTANSPPMRCSMRCKHKRLTFKSDLPKSKEQSDTKRLSSGGVPTRVDGKPKQRPTIISLDGDVATSFKLIILVQSNSKDCTALGGFGFEGSAASARGLLIENRSIWLKTHSFPLTRLIAQVCLRAEGLAIASSA